MTVSKKKSLTHRKKASRSRRRVRSRRMRGGGGRGGNQTKSKRAAPSTTTRKMSKTSGGRGRRALSYAEMSDSESVDFPPSPPSENDARAVINREHQETSRLLKNEQERESLLPYAPLYQKFGYNYPTTGYDYELGTHQFAYFQVFTDPLMRGLSQLCTGGVLVESDWKPKFEQALHMIVELTRTPGYTEWQRLLGSFLLTERTGTGSAVTPMSSLLYDLSKGKGLNLNADSSFPVYLMTRAAELLTNVSERDEATHIKKTIVYALQQYRHYLATGRLDQDILVKEGLFRKNFEYVPLDFLRSSGAEEKKEDESDD